MAKIGLQKGSEKRLKVREKSGNFEMDIEWQPCMTQEYSKCTLHNKSTSSQVTNYAQP